jgi:RHS repeat-associated protein
MPSTAVSILVRVFSAVWRSASKALACIPGRSPVADRPEQATFPHDSRWRCVGKLLGGITYSLLYDGIDILRETRSDGTVYTYVHGPGVNEPLARSDQANNVTYYHADGLGSIIKMTDSSGAVVQTRQYDAWGNLEVGADQPGYAFTGREWDPETSLYYYRARYYDPKVGRFISEDPIGFAGGVNFFGYALNNPTRFADPSGLDVIVTFWPKDASGFGHVGVGVNNIQTEGFYSTNKPTCLAWGCDDPGRMLDDRAHHPGVTPEGAVIHTTPEQDAAMQAAIDERKRNPGNYNLHGRNCSRFVGDVLKAGGVGGVPDTRYPRDLYETLKEIEKQQQNKRP